MVRLKVFVRVLSLLALFLTVHGQCNEQSDSDGLNLEVWGCFQELADHYWIQATTSPVQYVYYSWEEFGYVLTINGLDNDGNIIAGRIALNPDTDLLQGVTVRNGKIMKFSVETYLDNAILTGSENGAEIRRVFEKKNADLFSLGFEENRNGDWKRVRNADLMLANSEMVTALGWVQRNPHAEAEIAAAQEAILAASPSFFKRLGTAIQDGVILGAQEGVRERVREEIENQ